MTTTLCTSGAALHKAGLNVNISGAAFADEFVNQAEGVIMVNTRYDWVTNYNSLTSGAKLLLQQTASDLAAIYLINYSMSGYTSRMEASTMLDVLSDRAQISMGYLKDKVKTDYMGAS